MFQIQGLNFAVTKTQQEQNSTRKFGFESTETANELDPFIQHEISPNCFIQIIPNFMIKGYGFYN